MGTGYYIGCNKCVDDNESYKFIDKIGHNEGIIFDIMTGGGMLCFCKEQLEKYYGIKKIYNRTYRLLVSGDPPDEIYKLDNSPINNEKIDDEIFKNIANNYEFTEYLGYLPYYCDTCKSLITQFYFQMKKNNNSYIPKYYCKNCNNILKPVCPEWEKKDEMGWADTLNHIDFELKMYENNEIITIKSNNESRKLVCKSCNNTIFKLIGFYMYD
jgi:hypothetical protein